MKKVLCLLLCAMLTLSLFSGCEFETDDIVLNVFNWGEYISDGDESWVYEDEEGNELEIPYLDINAAFEEYYAETHPGKTLHVNYLTFSSNEELYAKLTMSDASYDVIIPSEYLITKLINEQLIRPLNLDNIPNYQDIGTDYQAEGVSYVTDENGERTYYSATYTFCKVGLIYNYDLLSEAFEDFDEEAFQSEGWGVLWNEKYKDLGVLQFNNSRDAFATAQFLMMKEDGYEGEKSYINASVHDEGGKELYDRVLKKMKDQQPIIQKYVMDEAFNKMETGNAAIAPYYTGDYFTMTWNTDYDLRCFYPEEGTNSFLDAMCIPVTSRNPEIAEEYINFLLSTDEDPTKSIAAINAEYICYGSPVNSVREDPVYQYFTENELVEGGYDLLYGEGVFQFEKEGFVCLDDDTQAYLNECWDQLKIQEEVVGGESDLPLIVICGAALALLLVWLVSAVITKKKRKKYWENLW